MPVRTMADAVAELQESVEHIDGLVAEVRELKQSRRRWRIMMAGLAAVVVALGALLVYTVVSFNDARERDAEAAAATAAQVEAARLDGCRNRNDSARDFREYAETQFGIFEAATFSGNTTDRTLALLAQLRRALPQQSDTEFDCTGDGRLDDDDYPYP